MLACLKYFLLHHCCIVLFGDEEIARLILATDKPREHKKLGRRVKSFNGKAWNEKCEDIVKRGNLAKVNPCS